MVLLGLCVALFATPALAAVNLGLPLNEVVNFDGNGVFSYTTPFSYDNLGPQAQAIDSEMFGVGTISGAALGSDLGKPVWESSDEGPNFEMTFSFFDAVVTSSARTWLGAQGQSDAFMSATYADGAKMVFVQDSSKDFNSKGGPSLFDTTTGDYPTAYTLPSGGSATDNDEELFLELSMSGNSSVLVWRPGVGFVGGSFSSTSVEIVGGSGASQFGTEPGTANAFILTFMPTGWTFGGDINVTLTTPVPEPATFVFLATGLVSLIGYQIRRRMA